MAKVEDGKAILEALGLPHSQRTTIASYTLLALADLNERVRWPRAKRRSLKIHDILGFIKATYGKTYAENTRETVRRQVLHQFEQARVVDRNPDEPDLPTNSPRTHYALSEDALRAIRAYGTRRFATEAREFQRSHGALLEVYRAAKARRMIPVTLPSGGALVLSPGKHNALQATIIKEFAPRFAPGASLLYLGDAANKTLHLERDALASLGVPVTKHDKLPDVVLHDPDKGWLLLIEAVTSHGPVSPKRKRELEAVLGKCSLDRVYVSAFPDLAEFKRHLSNIAWETEVWVAEMADHMIHFNGEKFLGPP
jgi:type II restriction enzyme